MVFSGPLLLAPPPDPKRRIGSSRAWKTGTISRTLEPSWDAASQIPRLPLVIGDPEFIRREHLFFRVMDADLISVGLRSPNITHTPVNSVPGLVSNRNFSTHQNVPIQTKTKRFTRYTLGAVILSTKHSMVYTGDSLPDKEFN